MTTMEDLWCRPSTRNERRAVVYAALLTVYFRRKGTHTNEENWTENTADQAPMADHTVVAVITPRDDRYHPPENRCAKER